MKLWCLCQLIANVAIIYVRSLQNNIEGLIHDKIEQNIDNNLVKHVTFDYPTIPIEEQRTKMYETTKKPKFHHHHHHHHYHINKYLSIINDRINLITIADRRRKGKGQSIGNSSTTELKNRNPGKRLTHIH
ncbi:hypothetical protein KSF78_0008843 [Schistosoma japonicum]|nr:hypothetical protein KSF78_0008843 [Schistosoma japonicum]